MRSDVLAAGAIFLAVVAYLSFGPEAPQTPIAGIAGSLTSADSAAFSRRTQQGLHYYYDTKEYDKAETEFRQALQIEPGNPLAYGNLGSVLLSEKKLDEAIAVLTKAVALDSSLQSAKNNLVWAQRQKVKSGR